MPFIDVNHLTYEQADRFAYEESMAVTNKAVAVIRNDDGETHTYKDIGKFETVYEIVAPCNPERCYWNGELVILGKI